jgi:hypothetical protein
MTVQEAELKDLRKKLKDLEMERNILEIADTIFSLRELKGSRSWHLPKANFRLR